MKNSQKGFTLIEILVAMLVGGMLLSGLVIAIFQTLGITLRSSTQITALLRKLEMLLIGSARM